MKHDLSNWLSLIKLDLWHEGYVEGVGYVKACTNSGDLDLFYSTDSEIDLRANGIPVSNGMVLIKSGLYAFKSSGGGSEYVLRFALRNAFDGSWEMRLCRLICVSNEPWVHQIQGNVKYRKLSQNVYQMTKRSPYELKDRGNYSVYGRQLPKPHKFKS